MGDRSSASTPTSSAGSGPPAASGTDVREVWGLSPIMGCSQTVSRGHTGITKDKANGERRVSFARRQGLDAAVFENPAIGRDQAKPLHSCCGHQQTIRGVWMKRFRQSVGLHCRRMVQFDGSQAQSRHGAGNPLLQRTRQLDLSPRNQPSDFHRRDRRNKAFRGVLAQHHPASGAETWRTLERPNPHMRVQQIPHAFISHSDANPPCTKSSSAGRRFIKPRRLPSNTPPPRRIAPEQPPPEALPAKSPTPALPSA